MQIIHLSDDTLVSRSGAKTREVSIICIRCCVWRRREHISQKQRTQRGSTTRGPDSTYTAIRNEGRNRDRRKDRAQRPFYEWTPGFHVQRDTKRQKVKNIMAKRKHVIRKCDKQNQHRTSRTGCWAN